MKALLLYLIMLMGGAAAGAFGVGAYNVFTGAVAVEEVAEGEDGSGEEGEEGEDGTGDPDGSATAVDGGEEGVESDPGDPELAAVDPAASDDPQAGGEATVGAGTTTAAGQTPASAAATPVVQVPPPDPDSLARLAQNYQRLARIFSAMKPDEAAPVLAQLDDSQLEGILLAMQGRNAAPILAEMDPERAAALSRKVLRGNR